MAHLIENLLENVDYNVSSIGNENQIFVNFHAKPLQTPSSHKSSFSSKPFDAIGLLDCGATSCFIHPSLVKECRLPRYVHEYPKRLRVIDGREIASGLITHFTRFKMIIDHHEFTRYDPILVHVVAKEFG